MIKLDILAIGAHPDDVELSCSGTLAKYKAQGRKTGVIDLTRGELGTRGTVETRAREAEAAARILGLDVRENLGMRDGFFRNDEEHQLRLIRAIRKYQPQVLLINAPEDRHPDHGRGHELTRDAAFLSGLRMIETRDEAGQVQEAWRPRHVFSYIQDRYLTPSFVVDITDFFTHKTDSIRAYGTQFYQPGAEGQQTYISSQDFWHSIEARCRTVGHLTGVTFGEGFIAPGPVLIHDIFSL